MKCHLPWTQRSHTVAAVFVPEHPVSCWWGIYRAATAEPGHPCTGIPVPAWESVLWHALAACKERTCNSEEQLFFYHHPVWMHKSVSPSLRRVNPGMPGLEGEQCGHQLQNNDPERNQLQFGSTAPVAHKFALLFSKQGRLIQHQTPCCGQAAVGIPEESEVALVESMKSLLLLVLVKDPNPV